MQTGQSTGTAWTVCLDEYAYLRGIDRPGWAWEFLRRNAKYRSAHEAAPSKLPSLVDGSSNPKFLRSHHGLKGAEAWGLVLFRRPDIDGASGFRVLARRRKPFRGAHAGSAYGT